MSIPTGISSNFVRISYEIRRIVSGLRSISANFVEFRRISAKSKLALFRARQVSANFGEFRRISANFGEASGGAIQQLMSIPTGFRRISYEFRTNFGESFPGLRRISANFVEFRRISANFGEIERDEIHTNVSQIAAKRFFQFDRISGEFRTNFGRISANCGELLAILTDSANFGEFRRISAKPMNSCNPISANFGEFRRISSNFGEMHRNTPKFIGNRSSGSRNFGEFRSNFGRVRPMIRSNFVRISYEFRTNVDRR